MEGNAIVIEKDQYIGIITLNRPEQLNTFNTALATELNNALIQLDNDPDIRVVVIKVLARPSPQGLMSLSSSARAKGNTMNGSHLWKE